MVFLPRQPNPLVRNLYADSFFFLLNLALLVLLHGRNLYDSDEGVILNGAWNLFNGRGLYIDFFEYVPPGGFYVVYATWFLTGASYWAAQLIGIAFLLLGATGVHLIARLVARESGISAPPWSIRIAPFLFCITSAMWPMINHNTFSIVVAIWACYFLLRSIRQQSSRDCVMAGCLAGLTFAFLQQRALAVVAGALGTYLLMWLRRADRRWPDGAIRFALATLIVPAILLVLFSPVVLFDDLYRFPAGQYWSVNRVDPAPLLVAIAAITLIHVYLRKERSDLVVALVIQQCALLLSVIARPDLSHVAAVIFPMLCLLPPVAARYVRNRPDTILGKSSAPLWLTVAVLFSSAVARFFVFSAVGEPKLISYVRDNCTASPYLYAGPFMPGVYFETRKLNATRYSVLVTGLNTDAQFRDAADDLSKVKVPCAVVNYGMVSKFRYSQDNPVDVFLDQNYRVVLEDGGSRVLKRVDGP